MEDFSLNEPAINAVATLAKATVENSVAEIVDVPGLDVETRFLLYKGQLTDIRTQFKPVPIPTLVVASLAGLVDYIDGNRDRRDLATLALIVRSHAQVDLVTPCGALDENFQRAVLAQAKLEDVKPFDFGVWHTQEQFIIGLLTRFEHTRELLELQEIVKNIVADESIQATDSGISQTVVVKQGAGIKAAIDVPSIWRLTPFRTFREVDQPESPFLLRMAREEKQPPKLTLLEADGGLWKVQARHAIKAYLVDTLDDRTLAPPEFDLAAPAGEVTDTRPTPAPLAGGGLGVPSDVVVLE